MSPEGPAENQRAEEATGGPIRGVDEENTVLDQEFHVGTSMASNDKQEGIHRVE